jgi:hypothetical protein
VTVPALAAAVALLAAGPGEAAAPAGGPPELRFVDTAAAAGLDRPTWCGGEGKPHLLESGGTGLALFDYDRDGDLDLYLVNGWRLEGPEVAERGRDLLYRNRGDGTFEDVTARAGLGSDGWGTGVAAGDVDGDGWTDLLVTQLGPDVLYRNRGDGTFEAAPDGPGIDGWSTGAAFFDADGDGDEDLFVAGYVDCTQGEVLHAEPKLDWEGTKVMLGPFGLEGLANRYFVNDGAGRFREATQEAGLTDVGLFYSFTVAALDLDGDLDTDLYVANDSNPNYLYQNDGHGRFREVGLWSGAALSQTGMAQAGMGLATGDLDGDGLADLLVTNFARDTTTLYRNLGDLAFEDVTRPLGVRDPTFQPLSWGATLADLDLDGDLDLFIANGHIYPQADEVPASGGYGQKNLMLAWQDGRFVDATERAGPGLEVVEPSRGVATGDVDGDGDLDLAISNVDARPTLLRNDSPAAGAWLMVDAPQALVLEVAAGPAASVEAGGEPGQAGGGADPPAPRRWFRHRVAGGSYVSVSDPRFHVGLGAGPPPASLRLTWPGGRRLVLREPPTDAVLVVRP